MNGSAAQAWALARQLLEGSAGLTCDLLVCPPFPYLAAVAGILAGSPLHVGGQDCHPEESGAHTGDVSAAMLVDVGCTAVILGHSERRQNHGETDTAVRAKAQAAARAGLSPIICVGETEAEREAGRETEVVGRQIAASLPDRFVGAVAYEPIWAIGTGRTPSVAEVGAVHQHIRAALAKRLGATGEAVRILYGGSVKPDNAAELLAVAEVGGALVGGASLRADTFLAIARAAC